MSIVRFVIIGSYEDVMESLNEIRQFIVENFLFGDGEALKDDTSFTEEGIIDSTGVLELVFFLEENFGITVEDSELVPENMDSLQSITAFVDRKKKAGSTQKP
jgi:acyl carrier protein